MLTNALNLKDFKEVISDNNQPLLFDSGNPFMSSHTVLFDKKNFKFKSLGSLSVNLLEGDESVKSFFDKQISYSLLRAGRFKKNPYVLNNTGVAFLNSGNYKEAQEYFEKAIELNKSFYPALANLARLYFQQAMYDKALDIYNELIKYFPSDIKVLQNISHVLFKKGELDKALTVLLEVIKKDDKNASAYNNSGVIYIIKHDINKAIHYLRSALAINENFANAHNNLGNCYALQKEYEKAIRSYLSAISLNKNFVVAIKNLARIYQEVGEHEKVFAVIEKCLVHNKPDSEMFNILADSSYMSKKYQQAIVYLNKAINLPTTSHNPAEQSRIYNNMAVAYSYLGKSQESYKYYLESIAMDKHPVTFNNLFNSLLWSNKLTEAEKVISEARALFPDNPDLLVSEGKCLYATKDYQNAIKALRGAISMNPKLATPYLLLNHIVTEVDKNLDGAISIARSGLKYNPKDVGLINNLAYTLLQTNNKDNINEARQLLDKVLDSENLYLIATRGLLALKENNVHNAERLYNRAAAIAESEELRNRVKQKKLLELGKYYFGKDEEKKAKDYLKKALKIKTKHEIYIDQARELLGT